MLIRTAANTNQLLWQSTNMYNGNLRFTHENNIFVSGNIIFNTEKLKQHILNLNQNHTSSFNDLFVLYTTGTFYHTC